ncbi:type II toxin-antitoxin system VapC family toxin [Desulfobacca acetoxidans]|uniref:Ribonuclease VapC n=1 Tax=Desulfobacca acetoxidans (strain ATCC 700848 / DSM 11109 / ASRB2) TaxID=880072 RepID=F2NGP5_DESAR|nr:type II toxin-antitoxin system VapC family toxin [Desulfobacca acetoxidans]AEB07952.1 PilT protein domain protein [Desulfobacca acetoxidans DSM 11109]
MRYVLDSCALLALAEDELGAQTVADIILDEKAELYLSAVNLGEAYYIVLQRRGEEAAAAFVQGVRQEDKLTIAEATWPRVKAAARIKAGGGLSYADTFGLGLAQELGACLVTGDPELQVAATKIDVELLWIGR